MRLVNHVAMLWLAAAASAAPAQDGGRAMLRIGCEGDSVDAAVSINGEMRGQCPFDTAVPAGNLHIVAVKTVDDTHERRFERDLFMGAGTQKRLDIELPPSRLTPAAQAAEDARLRAEEEKVRLAAEAKMKTEALVKATEPYRDAARKATDPLAAEAALQAAEKIDPSNREVHFLRAAFAAFGTDRAALEAALAGPFRQGWLSVDGIGSLPDIDRWLKDADFVRFLTDLLGDPEKMARITLLASPQGRQAILSNGFQWGPMALMVASRNDGKGNYRRFVNRSLTAIVPKTYIDSVAPNCSTEFQLGELIAQNPFTPVTLTWRGIGWDTGDAAIEGDKAIELLNANYAGWDKAFIITSSHFQARWLVSAMHSLHLACAPFLSKK